MFMKSARAKISVPSIRFPMRCHFGRLWYEKPNVGHAIGYAKFRSRSHDAVIRVYDDAGDMIETHEHAGEFKDW